MAGARETIVTEVLDEMRADRTGAVARGYLARLATARRRLARRLAAGAPRPEAAALKDIVAALAAGETLVGALGARMARASGPR